MDIDDLFGKASIDSDYAIATTVKTARTAGDSVLEAYDVSKFSDDTPVFFVTYKKTTDPITDVVTVTNLVSYKALVNAGANTLTNLEVAPGYVDLGNDEDDFIECIPTSYWVNSLINALLSSHNPDGSVKVGQGEAPGVVKQFAGSSAPSSYLMCDGASYLRATYEDLFDVIGTTYGAADGTHFNVPDMRSRLPIGVGTGTFNFTFASGDVNTGTDAVAVTASDNLRTGRKIQLTTTGTLPTGLSLATDYYLIVVDSTHVQFATTESNALYGTAINITGAGSGTNTATGTLTARTLGEVGGSQKHSHAAVGANLVALGGYVAGNPNFKVRNQTPKAGAGNYNIQLTATGANASSVSDVANRSVEVYGDTQITDVLPPFLALNYIIKT